MTKHQWIAISLFAIVPACGLAALGQARLPTAPVVPQVAPPVAPSAGDVMAATELRIGLQKAQIQATLADHVAQVKEEALKTLMAKSAAATADQEAVLNAQADAIAARAAAEAAKAEVASLDVQNRAGPAALQQAQSSVMPQQGGFVPAANPLVAQLMQMDMKKTQIQSAAAAQVTPIKQKIYDLVLAKQKAGTATAEQVADAMLDAEGAKAAQQTAALDEQLMAARMNAAGVK